MAGRRIQRLNSLIKREISKILLKEIDFPNELLATVTRVETSKDLANTYVYVSFLPEDRAKSALKILNSNIYNIQKRLNKTLKIKILPKIHFLEEKKTKEAAQVEKLLEEIRKSDNIS